MCSEPDTPAIHCCPQQLSAATNGRAQDVITQCKPDPEFQTIYVHRIQYSSEGLSIPYTDSHFFHRQNGGMKVSVSGSKVQPLKVGNSSNISISIMASAMSLRNSAVNPVCERSSGERFHNDWRFHSVLTARATSNNNRLGCSGPCASSPREDKSSRCCA